MAAPKPVDNLTPDANSPAQITNITSRVEEPKEPLLTNSSFLPHQLTEAYNRFVDTLLIEKPRIHGALATQQPQMASATAFQLKMSNQNIIEEFNKSVKSALLNSLKKELGNSNITLDIILEENQTTNLIYSPEDKFRHLQSKNPLLAKMRQQYGLDFD